MKIYVGPKAHIVGTKKVANGGTVNGLNDLVGKNVLIVVPSETPRVLPTPKDYVSDLQVALKSQARRALGEFRQFRLKLEKSSGPATKYVLRAAPVKARKPIQRAEARLWGSVRSFEKQVAQLVKA